MSTDKMSNKVQNGNFAKPMLGRCAIEWWNKLEHNLNDGFSKWQLGYKYFDRHWMSLTGREIEIIYKCEKIA